MIKLVSKYDQKLIWVATGYSEWKTNLILNKHASGNNSCNCTERWKIHQTQHSIKAFKIRNVFREKNLHKQAILEEQESIQITWMAYLTKLTYLETTLTPNNSTALIPWLDFIRIKKNLFYMELRHPYNLNNIKGRLHHGVLPDWVFCPFRPQNPWELRSKLPPIIWLRTTEKNCCLVPVLSKPLHEHHSNGCTFTRETDKLKILIINNCTVRHSYTSLCVCTP